MIFDLHLDLEVYLNKILRKFLKDSYYPLDRLYLKRHFDLIQGRKANLKFLIGQVQSLTVKKNKIVPINNFNIFLENSFNFLKEIKKYQEINIIQKIDNFKKLKTLNIILGCEGLYFLKKIEELEKMWEYGFRVFGLCWNLNSKITGTILEHKKGLTKFGEKIVKKIISLNGIIDLAHVSNKTRKILIQKYPHNVIFSHNNIYKIHPFNQNLDDEILKLVKKYNILVGLSFLPKSLKENSFLGWKKNYDFLKKFNPSSLALGTDFFGFSFWETASDSQNYLVLKKNFKKFKINEKLMFENCVNFFYNQIKKWN